MIRFNIYNLASMTDAELIKLVESGQPIPFESKEVASCFKTRWQNIFGKKTTEKKAISKPKSRKKEKVKPWYQIF